MDNAQSWIISNWVTISAATLIFLNIILACFTYKKFLIYGAIGLACSWAMSIAAFLLARGGDLIIARLAIDAFFVLFFYRLAERDKMTGERHDWAALICFAYVSLFLLDLRELIFTDAKSKMFRATTNVIFYAKLIANIVPSMFIISGGRRILISELK